MEIRFLNRPGFVIFGTTLRFRMKTRPWQLQMMKRLKWLRNLLPEWHAKEKTFRDWYITLLKGFHFQSKAEYDRYVNALKTPEEVRGYREIRYPKMDEARRRAHAYLEGRERFSSDHDLRIISDKVITQ